MRQSLAALFRNRTRAPRQRAGLVALDSVARATGPRDPTTLRDEILDQGLTTARALELGNALEAEGRFLDAVQILTVANHMRRDASIEQRLVRLRRAAFAELDRSLPPPPWPPFVPEDAPGAADWPPVVTPKELTTGVVRNGILGHGSVLIRGLVSPARAARLRQAIDRAFEAYDAAQAGRSVPDAGAWFHALDDIPDGDEVRRWGRKGESVFTADSPRALYEFLETLHETGLDHIIGGYFGERPALSVQKCTLRRVDATVQHAIWHQDGAFLGKGIRTVDAWFALTRCGRDAPGMDIVPKRINHLLTTGETGAGFDWTVSADTIARELPGVQIWRPEFEVGDVLLFDHMMLHRTAAAPGMRNVRYAIESWFFAPSVYPDTSTPIVV